MIWKIWIRFLLSNNLILAKKINVYFIMNYNKITKKMFEYKTNSKTMMAKSVVPSSNLVL